MFEGKTFFVSGAGAGIGRAAALLFSRNGAKVACADIRAEHAEETAELIRAQGGQSLALRCDVRDADAVAETIGHTIAWGGGLHHAFNNAGISGQHVDMWNEPAIANTMAVNLMGVVWAMKHQIAHMTENGGGTIVNTASIAGISGHVGALDYTAAKHGVVGISKAAAMKFGAKGVRINAVCPGVIDTDMTRDGGVTVPGAAETIRRLSPITGGLGEADDIAQAVLWLSSPLSKFVYGVALPVDGGFSIN